MKEKPKKERDPDGFLRPLSQVNLKRLREHVKDKLIDSGEVATDEGDDRDFQEEMSRIQWKPSIDRRSSHSEEGGDESREAEEDLDDLAPHPVDPMDHDDLGFDLHGHSHQVPFTSLDHDKSQCA